MARPRIFVSSTYYDLRHIRAVLQNFIEQLGYEPVLFEKGSIPFFHDRMIEDSCVKEVEGADILILIIGGRYGSPSREDQDSIAAGPGKIYETIRSVTRKEYECARERDIPVFIFVDENVLSEYRTYQQNRNNDSIEYAHVDDVRIYEMLGDIFGQQRNNYVKGFSNSNDIVTWLRDQWAGLFTDYLRRQSELTKIETLKSQVEQLATVVKSIQNYSEEIVKATLKSGSSAVIERERAKILLRAEEEMSKDDVLRWFSTHEATKDSVGNILSTDRSKVFNSLIKAPNTKSFLRNIGLNETMIEESTLGVEVWLGRKFGDLRKRLIDLIT